MNSKNVLIFRDVLNKYHPEFSKSRSLRRYAAANPNIFNVELLIEEALAFQGGYDRIDAAGQDFNDPRNSDSKTTSVCCNSVSKSLFTLCINNLESKVGSVRATICNPYADRVDFMYLPKTVVDHWKENNGTSGRKNVRSQRIRTSWNRTYDHYNKLECYRLPDFTSLATCMD